MKKEYSFIIIDDDDFARETLEELLSKIPYLKLLKSISDSDMAIKHLVTLKPDLIFLDVNMPNKTGIEVQKEVVQLQLESKIIFTTAHKEYVLEAFKNDAFDYLVKPVKKSELQETLLRFINQGHKTEEVKEEKLKNNEVVLKSAIGTTILKNEDIIYIEADGGYTTIYLQNGTKEIISKNIGKVEQQFNDTQFFKISRSHIINTNYLKRTDRLNKKITLKYGERTIQLKVSREKFYDLEQKI